MRSALLSAWFPDRAPTWTDVAVAALAVAWLVFDLRSLDRVAWGWVAAGFLSFVVGAGPGAKSAPGRAVGRWFRAVGVVGRILLVLLFAAGVWLADATLGIPPTPATSFAAGVMLGVVAFVPAHVLYAGGVG